jgi:hypothetical protein
MADEFISFLNLNLNEAFSALRAKSGNSVDDSSEFPQLPLSNLLRLRQRGKQSIIDAIFQRIFFFDSHSILMFGMVQQRHTWHKSVGGWMDGWMDGERMYSQNVLPPSSQGRRRYYLTKCVLQPGKEEDKASFSSRILRMSNFVTLLFRVRGISQL